MLATGCFDKTVRIWDVVSGELLQTFKEHKDEVRSIAFSPDGNMLASGGWEGTVFLWNVASTTDPTGDPK